MVLLSLNLICFLTLSLFAAALAAPAITKRTVTTYLSAINTQVTLLNLQLATIPTEGVAQLSQVLVRFFSRQVALLTNCFPLSAFALLLLGTYVIYTMQAVHTSMLTLANILSMPTLGVLKEETSADNTSAVLAQLESLVPAIEDTLSQFIGKEGVIAATPDPTLVPTLNADLTTVQADTGTALDSVIGTLPALFQGPAMTIVSGLGAMFDEAIAAYSEA
ncbi:hypothetical protein GGX14DRAFT_563934 [Mycena pura]|uniref:Uncharacterized protein n=1 Tax=Mycena pura TaxID=153505 RepID=A0AAD6YIZ9_9AGAR|nr:hypothetical protein GGX14DRAFT_563934 [Mycena pura]